MRSIRFRNRREAGQRLAERLAGTAGDIVVVALPRGGVPVAAEVARTMSCPLDVIIVAKLGVPMRPELGFGAVSEDGVRVLNRSLIRHLDIADAVVEKVTALESAAVERKVHTYRQGRSFPDVSGKTVIVVDDGIATGFTAKAAVELLRLKGPERVVLASPVAAPESVEELRAVADEVIVLETPSSFMAVGQWYADFEQVSDAEVAAILAEFDGAARNGTHRQPVPTTTAVTLNVGPEPLSGLLSVPDNAEGLVIFAHGSGSSRLSPRNTAVASFLNDCGMATLLFDLLTEGESASRANVFDIELLADRLEFATRWVEGNDEVGKLPVGYFGASTGAAAALVAAARPGSPVAAVVSRGGRPDLAGHSLTHVKAPTLLIVGGWDRAVLDMNREARRHMHCASTLEVVPGASHLFEEPGTLDVVMHLASDWFDRHLT